MYELNAKKLVAGKRPSCEQIDKFAMQE